MKLSKEIKIGLLVSISVLIFFAGFYSLKGSNLFSAQKKYYCYFDDVDGLQVSAIVQIRGLNVGRVSNVKLLEKRVQVTIDVQKNIKLHKGTQATLASADLLSGTKVINLKLGDSSDIIESGSTLPSYTEKGLLDNISDDVSPVIQSAKIVMAELDSIVGGVSDIINDKNKQAITNSLTSIESASKDISVLTQKLRGEGDNIQNIISKTNNIANNLSTTSEQVSKAPIKQSIDEMQQTVVELQSIVKKINEGQGSLGMMVTDKALYNNLNTSLSSLDKLMTDLKAHPSRYINISVFGKKNKD